MLMRWPRLSTKLFGLTEANRLISTTLYRTISNKANPPKNFEDMVDERQSQANRSIVVQVASAKSYDDVHKYCSQFGTISNAYFYSTHKHDSFILLEYANQNDLEEAFRSSAFLELGSGVVPVKSSFLWFRNTPQKQKLKSVQPVALNTSSNIVEPKPSTLVDILKGAASVTEQIQLLYENTRLNEISIRLRFLGALQIQRALNGLFLNHTVLPFGSTVNGFGRLGCDLDMILHYNTDDKTFNAPNNYGNRRLVFHTKGSPNDTDTMKRGIIESHIKFYGILCDSFIPGAVNVTPIHKARVPIVRYFHRYLDVSVDISLLNLTGFYISELFYIFGELDDRVRPLVFVVRRWAQEIQLTSKTRTHSITNFQLTCLVLSFLQQLRQPILPTTTELVSKARKCDVRRSDDDRNYTFLRDISAIEFSTENTSTLEELFAEFLEFYGSFDCTKYLISLTSKKPIRKIEQSAMQIANPFEMEQNWGRNISNDECIGLKMYAQDSFANLLNINAEASPNKNRWGLLSIFPNLK